MARTKAAGGRYTPPKAGARVRAVQRSAAVGTVRHLPTSGRFSLPVIPKPVDGTRSVLVSSEPPSEDFVFIKGDSTELIFECGNCHRPLMTGITWGQVKNIVLGCPFCNAFNDTPF